MGCCASSRVRVCGDRQGDPTSKKLCLAVCVAACISLPAIAQQSAVDSYRLGSQAESVGDYYQAIDYYKAALAANLSYLGPMVGLAESFFYLEQYDEASRWVDKARAYAGNDANLTVLAGRIELGQGDVKSARALFQNVLASQPNNLEARFGMAEADVADGRTTQAYSEYTQSLTLAPESTKALLSLATLSDQMGDQAAATHYFELALGSHSDDPEVELRAADWYARHGNLTAAEQRAKIAFSLQSSDLAEVLLGSIYLQTNRAQDAVTTLKDVVGRSRSNTLAWYGLGLAYAKQPDVAKAFSSYDTALSIRPDDEVSRIAEESLALDALKMDDTQRKGLAVFHVKAGSDLETRGFLEQALTEYRRALVIDPTSTDARVGYARVFLTQGFPAKYTNELEVLTKLGVKDTFVTDEVEAYQSRLAGSLSNAWGVDQFALERLRYTIPVYTIPAADNVVHFLSTDLLTRYFQDLLTRYDSVSVPSGPLSVGGVNAAFDSARGASADYFLVLAVAETDRDISATGDLYLASTGERVASYAAYRTGNDKVRDSFLKIASQLAAALPPRGTLLQRKFDQGLVDLGTLQGIKKGDSLVVLRHGSVGLDAQAPGLSYAEADVVGTFTVTDVDEGVAAGTLARKGYFDYMNPGDQVIMPVVKKANAAPAPPPQTNLLKRLLGIK